MLQKIDVLPPGKSVGLWEGQADATQPRAVKIIKTIYRRHLRTTYRCPPLHSPPASDFALLGNEACSRTKSHDAQPLPPVISHDFVVSLHWKKKRRAECLRDHPKRKKNNSRNNYTARTYWIKKSQASTLNSPDDMKD